MTKINAGTSFEEVCLPHRASLYRFACRWTHNADDAEDLVQETMARAYQYFDTFCPGGSASAWLYTIMRNCFANICRKRYREGRPVSLAVLDDRTPSCSVEGTEHLTKPLTPVQGGRSSDPERAAVHRAEARAALDAVEALPAAYRQILLLVADETDGFSYQEIAQQAGLPIGTVRSRIHRGRAQIQRRLENWGNTPSSVY